MIDRLARVEERLHELNEAFDALRDRVATLEGEARNGRAVDVPVAAMAPAAVDVSVGALPILTLVGRTFLVFGGAYLLRALTDTGRIPPAGGVVAGLAYAFAWIGAADRAALRRPASGVFHGLASLLIACPLLLEAATRFGVLSPAGAAGLLVGITFAALSVAWHRDLQALAGIATVAASLTAFTLALTTGRVVPFAAAAIVTGATAEWYGASREWRWPARPAVLTASLLVLDVIARAHGLAPIEPVGAAFATCLLLAVVHAMVLTASAILRQRELSILDISQSLAALVVGLGGAFALARSLGPVALDALGIALLTIGVGGYLFLIPRANQWPDRASAVLTSLAALVLIVGGAARLTGGWRDLAFGIASLTLLTIGRQTGRPWLATQGALFAIAVAVTSGMLPYCADAWTGGIPAASVSLSTLGATAILGVGGVILPRLMTDHSRGSPVPALVLTALAAFGVGALGILLLDAYDGRAATTGITAAERSVVVSVLAIALTALSRVQPVRMYRWLAYATIALGAIKLAAEDMRVSSPMAIFVALGAYGVALIVTAKLLGPDLRTLPDPR